MEESEKENLFITFQQTIKGIIEDKRKNPKNEKLLNNFKAKINLGLQTDDDYYFWLNLKAEDGIFVLEKDRLEEFDLEVMAAPEDLLFFANGENSLLNMLFKKNRFGLKKLRFSGGSNGKRNIGILMRLPKILVLD